MRLCEPHWATLQQAIRDRGLWHLVGAASAKAQVDAELAGEPAAEAPRDPLLSASMSIFGRALEAGGLYLMQGELCPICECLKNCVGLWKNADGSPMTSVDLERYWIDGPADAELQAARERGSVPPPQ